MKLSPKQLRQMLRLDPDTGKLYWRERGPEWFNDGFRTPEHNMGIWNARYANTEAFTSYDTNGYFRGKILGKAYASHRVVWTIYYGEWPKDQIDHINGIRDDNRIVNLRVVSNSENSRNIKIPATNTSGKIGVSWKKPNKKWQAQIKVNGSIIYLGLFADKRDAVEARKAAEIKHGFHKNHGRVGGTR